MQLLMHDSNSTPINKETFLPDSLEILKHLTQKYLENLEEMFSQYNTHSIVIYFIR